MSSESDKSNKEDSSISMDVQNILQPLIRHFKEQYKLSKADLISMYDGPGETKVPLAVFSGRLSPLEALVAYLKENKGLRFSEIASMLNRDNRIIWRTYHQAKDKGKISLDDVKNELFIPVSIFKNRKLSVLENLAIFAKEELSISVKSLSLLINKSQSTVWTAYSRAQKKRAK